MGPTDTRFGPVRADGDTATAASSTNHYARKYDRQVRRANRHAFRSSKGGWGHSYRGQQHGLYKAAKHDAKAQYAANMYAARLAASVCMAVSSAAPTTTLESMTARCAAPTGTRFGPVRADGDTATAASSTSCTRRPSTMLRRSTQQTCTLPRPVSSD